MGVPPSVARVVARALDRRIRSCEQATAGRMAQTYLLTLDGDPGRAVCKVGGPSIRTGDIVEPLVVRLVDTTTDLPVPSVLATGRLRGRARERRWALYEFCAGETPTQFRDCPGPVRRRLLETVGSALGRLHATHQFERTGALARDGDGLRVTPHRGVHAPTRGRALLGRCPGSDRVDSRPVLGHGDLYPGNLLVNDGEVTALLDWGNAHVTTTGYALARAELRFVDWFRFPARERERLRKALRRGYERHRPLPPDYPGIATPHKLFWLVQSGARHLRHLTTGRGRRQLVDHARSALDSLGG